MTDALNNAFCSITYYELILFISIDSVTFRVKRVYRNEIIVVPSFFVMYLPKQNRLTL